MAAAADASDATTAAAVAAAATAAAAAAAPRGKVVVVAGPTAVGKLALAFKLCEQYNGEIISADSVQVYRGLDIGSNKVRQV